MLACFDLPPAPRWLKWFVPAVLRLRAAAVAAPPRRGLYVDQPLRSCVNGYSVAELGPLADWAETGLTEDRRRDPATAGRPSRSRPA